MMMNYLTSIVSAAVFKTQIVGAHFTALVTSWIGAGLDFKHAV